MKYFYSTRNQVCAQSIEVEIENNTIVSVKFNGGCDGNHKGIAALAVGMQINEAIRRLAGITCGMRNTSCPDQLACALKQYLQENKQ